MLEVLAAAMIAAQPAHAPVVNPAYIPSPVDSLFSFGGSVIYFEIPPIMEDEEIER